MVEGNGSFGAIKDRVTKTIELLSFAKLLWELFRALIFGTLEQFISLFGEDSLKAIKDAIDCTVAEFLMNALQLDEESLKHEKRAVRAGVL